MKFTTVKLDNVVDVGVVTGASVYGPGLITAIAYTFSSILGISSKMMENKINYAKSDAMKKLSAQAAEAKADGVMDIRYQFSFLTVFVSGTAFRYKRPVKNNDSVNKDTSQASESASFHTEKVI